MTGRLLQALALAGLLLAVALPAPAALSATELARAEEIVQGKCFICHGVDGESSSPVFPRLSAQNARYVARQLADYASGRRRSTTMQPMVEGLTPADFAVLGAYFATRSPQAHAPADAELSQVGRYTYLRGNPESGLPACASCHGADGHGTDQLPRLAGQHAQYIENQLRQFHRRERTNDNAVMHGIAAQLSELERKAVAAYLAGLK
jgi:cytochrome c553